MTCGACREVVYCSEICQRAHWSAHKPVCKAWLEIEKGEIASQEEATTLDRRLQLFVNAAKSEQLAAFCSALKVFSPTPINETHELVLYLSHNKAEQDPTVAFKVLAHAILTVEEVRNAGHEPVSSKEVEEVIESSYPGITGLVTLQDEFRCIWEVVEGHADDDDGVVYRSFKFPPKLNASNYPPPFWNNFNDPDWFQSLRRRLSIPGRIERLRKRPKPTKAAMRDVNRYLEAYEIS